MTYLRRLGRPVALGTLGLATAWLAGCGALEPRQVPTTQAPDATPGDDTEPDAHASEGSDANAPAAGPAPTPPASPNLTAPSADNENLVVGPSYTTAAASKQNTKVPAGKRTSFTLDANVNRFFNANNDFNRTVWTYVPAQHDGSTPLPLIVVQDGASYVNTVAVALDNLIAARKLPNVAAVFVSSGPGGARSVEYDTVSPAYADFVLQRVLPRAQSIAKVTFSTDPNWRATFGTSSGGAAAFTMAYFRPESFRRVCTYSGSYTGIRPTAAYPHGAWSYHESLIAAAKNLGLRVALEVGEHDHVFPLPYRNTIVANQQMATVLMARGYPTRFVFALDADHVDARVIGQTLPDALVWLMGSTPP